LQRLRASFQGWQHVHSISNETCPLRVKTSKREIMRIKEQGSEVEEKKNKFMQRRITGN
jgi:hypothetical protein